MWASEKGIERNRLMRFQGCGAWIIFRQANFLATFRVTFFFYENFKLHHHVTINHSGCGNLGQLFARPNHCFTSVSI